MLKVIKILNFIKSLCTIFCIKMLPVYIISFPIYIIQKKELKHFVLDILVVYGILAQNIITSIHLYFYVLNCFKYVHIYFGIIRDIQNFQNASKFSKSQNAPIFSNCIH